MKLINIDMKPKTSKDLDEDDETGNHHKQQSQQQHHKPKKKSTSIFNKKPYLSKVFIILYIN